MDGITCEILQGLGRREWPNCTQEQPIQELFTTLKHKYKKFLCFPNGINH